MKSQLLIVTLFGVLFSSCQISSFVTIEVKRPAEIVIPKNVKTVAIINNTVDQPDNFGHKATSSDGESTKNAVLNLKTSGYGDLFTKELSNRLKELNWFEIIYKKLYASTYKTFLEDQSLSGEMLKEISDTTHADMVISLDRYLFESDLKLDYKFSENYYQATMDVRAYPIIRIYDVDKSALFYKIEQKDSLYWLNYGISSETAIAGLPFADNCFYDIVMYGVDCVMKKLVPYSEQVHRLYYISGNPNMRDAKYYIKQNRWEDAAAIWEYIFLNNKRTKLKAFSAANMALYCEITDKYDQAIDWAEKAVKYLVLLKADFAIEDIIYFEKYILELKQRQNDTSKLDCQLGQ